MHRLALLLAGCGPPVGWGYVSTCAPQVGDAFGVRTIMGTVLADDVVAPDALERTSICTGDPARALHVVDPDGTEWTLGYGLRDHDTTDLTPALDLDPGEFVAVILDLGRGPSSVEPAFAVWDETGLAAVFDPRTGSPVGEDVSTIHVERGERAGREHTGCGSWVMDTLIFSTGQDEVEVTPVGTALLPVGEVEMTVFAMAALTPVEPFSCTDVYGWKNWAAVRE